MACRIGACLGCVCHSKDIVEHSNEKQRGSARTVRYSAPKGELLTPDEQRERIASGIMIKRRNRHEYKSNTGRCGVKEPVMTCSGTFGSGMEYGEMIDLDRLGAVVTEGIAKCSVAGKSDSACDGSLRRNVKCDRSSGTGC